MFRKAAILAVAFLPFSFAQISNDFESGWDQTTWPIYAPDCNQGGTVALDTTTAHSGTNSIKVTSPGGYCGHIFFGTTAVPKGDVYVRVWLKATTALTANHVSFIVMPDPAQGTNEHLRIGGQDSILMYNRESNDATLPDLSPDGVASSVPLPAGSWECFEYHLGTDGSISTWLNSVAITGLTTPNAYDSGWTSSSEIPTVSAVYFGWESYGGDANTFWYDDVSIASTRVGCGAGSSSSTGPTTGPTTTGPTTTSSSPTTTAAPTTTSAAGSVPLYGQCGGTTYTGPTACTAGATCSVEGAYYSQCVPTAAAKIRGVGPLMG